MKAARYPRYSLFKFPELWDREFRASLEQTTTERARAHVQQADSEQKQQSLRERHSQALLQLKGLFFQLSAETTEKRLDSLSKNF